MCAFPVSVAVPGPPVASESPRRIPERILDRLRELEYEFVPLSELCQQYDQEEADRDAPRWWFS